jgi:non-ribosomal peptide synthetase component F
MQNTVLHYLENTCKKFPDKVAVTDEHGNMAFNELCLNAKLLAQMIIARPNYAFKSVIAVYEEKSRKCIVSDLAITYCGGTYMNLDVKSPNERIKNIIGTVKPNLIITDTKNKEKLLGIVADEMILDFDAVHFSQEILNE